MLILKLMQLSQTSLTSFMFILLLLYIFLKNKTTIIY